MELVLGRRGLYRSVGGAVATPDDERALLWVAEAERRPWRCWTSRATRLPFSLVSARYERAYLIVTSNKPFSAWARSSATR